MKAADDDSSSDVDDAKENTATNLTAGHDDPVMAAWLASQKPPTLDLTDWARIIVSKNANDKV